MWPRWIPLLPLLILSTGCAELTSNTYPAQNSAETTHAAVNAQAPPTNPADLPCIETTHGCISINPDVTQDTIGETICVTGYTATVRPSTSYTNGVKLKLLWEAGLDESHISEYELDHIIPLAIGGHPRKLSNLMLQPWDGEQGAHKKDGLERRLQGMVCRGDMSLVNAQRCIAEDWIACDADLSGR
jgi:hypothetical protein